jgi:predicted ribosome quality control (RQC) complex YloA/Tae2 family protein
VLTDHEHVILNLLRPRHDTEDQRIAVGEKYPMEKARTELRSLDVETWEDVMSKAKPNDNLKRLLNPRLDFGPALIEHCLLGVGFPSNAAVGKVRIKSREGRVEIREMLSSIFSMTILKKCAS